MSKRLALLAAIAIPLVLSGCSRFAPAPPAATVPPVEQPTETAPTAPSPAAERFEVYLQPNPSQESLTDVFARNLRSGEVAYLASLEDVYAEHYHGQELHRGSLYIIRREADAAAPEQPPSGLWRYTSDGQGTLLFAARGLDFRTAPDEQLIAVTYLVDAESGGQQRMAFLGAAGELAHEINTWLYNPDYSLQLISWSSDGGELWAALQVGARPMALLRITAGSWALRLYDLAALPLQHEYALNPDAARLAFSDHPAMYDADSAAAFAQSQTPVTLWLLDLETNTQRTIATTTARAFDPAWLGATTLEYNHPQEDGRITITLD